MFETATAAAVFVGGNRNGYYIAAQSSVPSSMSEKPETEELRTQIETIDEQIIDLIATRMEIADELAKAKRRSSQGYWDEEKQEWVDIYAYTEAEIQKIEEIINSTDRVYSEDEAIWEIVMEQIDAFFSGQRSAEDVAKLIQSKAMIYVNEQR